MTPQISVIVPVYNVEKYLPRCIDSILSQTFTDFELLLIDDGSPDNSGKICDEYAIKDCRVKVIHKQNGGVSSARNVGIENATGEWVFFSDADDILVPNAFYILTSRINSEVAYVMAGYKRCDENHNIEYEVKTRDEHIISSSDAVTQMFRPTDYVYQGYLWNKLFKLSVIKENNLKFAVDIYFNEDRLFNILYLLKIGNQKCIYTTEPVYHYVVRSSSAMASLKKSYNPKFATDLTAFIRALEQLRSSKDKKNIQLCKWASFVSYQSNLRMMHDFNAYDEDLAKRMYKELRMQISVMDLLKMYSKMAFGMIKNKIYNLLIKLK